MFPSHDRGANDNEIDTSSGNLTIDSAGGTVTIDDNLTINGNIDHTGVADFDNIFLDASKIDTRSGNLILDSATGTTTVQDNLEITGDLSISGNVNGSTVTFSGDVSEASGTFGNIRIAPGNDNNEINTSTGNLVLDSASGQVRIDDNLVCCRIVTGKQLNH